MIKICLIGAGRMSVEHIRVFNKIKNVNISAISSRTKKKIIQIKKNYPSIKMYTDINKMINTENPDGIIIAVNENSLLDVCRKVFAFSQPLLIEKPIGYNLNQNQKILRLMNKYKKKNCYVALNRRYFNSTKNLLTNLSKDKGKKKIYINDQQYNLKKMYPHKANVILKNMMFANSVHLIDYVDILSKGKIKNVKSSIKREGKISNVLSNINLSSGDAITYKALWNKDSKWSVSVFTKRFFYELKPLEELKILNLKNLHIRKFPKNKLDTIYKPGFMLQAIDFIKMIKKKPHSLVDIKNNFNTTKLINKIYENF
tara:strand:+ start:11462 stop:12403 length:942 start_codon:yes stop_codon:yes gene_type:complete